jgi:hypothetical protein
LDFPDELNAGLCSTIFGGDKTAQTANGDEEKSDPYVHYSNHAPHARLGQAITDRWPFLVLERLSNASVRKRRCVRLAFQRLKVNSIVQRGLFR